MENSSSRGSSKSHSFQHFRLSSGMASSQLSPLLHRSCRTALAGSTNGLTKPNGSYTELTIDNIPRRVGGLSLSFTLNPNVSDSKFHLTPRALSVGMSSQSSSFTELALSDAGIVASTFGELHSHLVKWKPPFINSSLSLGTSLMAILSLSTDFKQSST